jgi:uncharacterized protein YaeQ
MHGAALWAELGQPDDEICQVQAENHHHSISMFLRLQRGQRIQNYRVKPLVLSQNSAQFQKL